MSNTNSNSNSNSNTNDPRQNHRNTLWSNNTIKKLKDMCTRHNIKFASNINKSRIVELLMVKYDNDHKNKRKSRKRKRGTSTAVAAPKTKKPRTRNSSNNRSSNNQTRITEIVNNNERDDVSSSNDSNSDSDSESEANEVQTIVAVVPPPPAVQTVVEIDVAIAQRERMIEQNAILLNSLAVIFRDNLVSESENKKLGFTRSTAKAVIRNQVECESLVARIGPKYRPSDTKMWREISMNELAKLNYLPLNMILWYFMNKFVEFVKTDGFSELAISYVLDFLLSIAYMFRPAMMLSNMSLMLIVNSFLNNTPELGHFEQLLKNLSHLFNQHLIAQVTNNMNNQSEKKAEICSFWLMGRCERGDRCKYRHTCPLCRSFHNPKYCAKTGFKIVRIGNNNNNNNQRNQNQNQNRNRNRNNNNQQNRRYNNNNNYNNQQQQQQYQQYQQFPPQVLNQRR